MNVMTIDANTVKKDLYKSKATAKLSHYVGGSIYYTVELSDGTYQFPMSTTENVKMDDMPLKTKGELKEQVDIEIKHEWNDAEPLYVYDYDKELHVEATCKVLSSDLGTTPFYAEMKGSDLNRWIAMAIKAGEFVKVS
jgi:hypothetical protein